MGKFKVSFKPALTLLIIITILITVVNTVYTDNINQDIYFTILHTNDEHSSIIPHSSTTDYISGIQNPSIGGYARLSTLVKQIRYEKKAVNESVILLNAGDFMGGTAFSWLIPRGYAPELSIKQIIGYNAVTIGNHEYDYGTDVLTKYLINAGYPEAHSIMPVIAANTLIDENHPMSTSGLYKKNHIITLDNGLNIGLFGLIGKNAISVASDYYPFEFEQQADAARKSVFELKEMGADIIIALSHSGVSEDKELVKHVQGIDLIIGGHCHTALNQPEIEGDTIIVQAGSYLKYLGKIELSYDKVTGKLKIRNNNKPFLIPIDYSITEDAEIIKIIDEYTSELNELVRLKTNHQVDSIYDIIVTTDFPLFNTPYLSETTFGNYISDAMRIVTSQKTGKKVDVAIQANGSIRGSLYPGSIQEFKGNVSFYDITGLISLGYGKDGYAGYPITSFYLTGTEIRRALEVAALLSELKGDDFFLHFSGLKYDYNPKDAVLLTIPFMDLPIPTTKAVKKAYLYMNDDIQSENMNDYVKIEKNDEKLYHVVTDSYILSFLPMAGELLPQLDIVPKDINGTPVAFEDFDKLTVYDNNMELKVWQTVVEYSKNQPLNSDGIPRISDEYAAVSGRINLVGTVSYEFLLCVFFIIIFILIVLLIVNKKKKKLLKR